MSPLRDLLLLFLAYRICHGELPRFCRGSYSCTAEYPGGIFSVACGLFERNRGIKHEPTHCAIASTTLKKINFVRMWLGSGNASLLVLSKTLGCCQEVPLFRLNQGLVILHESRTHSSPGLPKHDIEHSVANRSLEQILLQLKCHFTWNLFKEKDVPEHLEERVREQIEPSYSKSKGTMYNLMAYIKHLDGRGEEALECLQQAEESLQQEHSDQAEVRNLVTWGNYAWVYYHLGELPKAQAYVDKVKRVCGKFSNPFSLECPELDSEEGWARLKCGNSQIKRATVCFEKALEKHPHDPEFASGLAIARHRESECPAPANVTKLLREAVELNPDNMYVKLLLAQQLQKMNNAEGEKLVEEFLEKGPYEAGMLQQAARFVRTRGDLDKAIELLERASGMLPNNTRIHYIIGSCYRDKVLKKVCGNNQMCQESDNLLQYEIEQGIDHLKKADNRNLSKVNLYLAFLYGIAGEYKEAERYYQREFEKELPPLAKQNLHLRYGDFQLYKRKCEDDAICHYMEGIKINTESYERTQMKKKLHDIAKRRISKNRTDSLALQILDFLQQQNEQI